MVNLWRGRREREWMTMDRKRHTIRSGSKSSDVNADVPPCGTVVSGPGGGLYMSTGKRGKDGCLEARLFVPVEEVSIGCWDPLSPCYGCENAP